MNKIIVTLNQFDYSVNSHLDMDNDIDIKEWVCPPRLQEVYENIVGHQIGNGAVQIIFNTGVQRVIANFYSVDIIPDDETQAKWLEKAEQAYKGDKVPIKLSVVE